MQYGSVLCGAEHSVERCGPPVALVDVKLILVPVTVMDRRGAMVNGLGKDSFIVLDEKVRQRIVSFSSEDAPCSVGLVLDLSGSMERDIRPAKEALTDFLAIANPEDRYTVLGVGTRPLYFPIGFTSDTTLVHNTIMSAPPGGFTALVDTIYAGLGKMRSAPHLRRALVVVSDGMDNHSRYSPQDLFRLAAEADVQIYTIAIDPVRHQDKAIQQIEARRGLQFLEDLANRTGGVHFAVQSRKEAAAAGERIGLAIRNQYLLGYQPGRPDSSGKWHRVQVKLNRDQVQVYARSGYYAQ